MPIEPDIVGLVGKCTERRRVAKSLVGYLLILPYDTLLVHNVTTGKRSVLVDNEGSVATLADGAYLAMGYALTAFHIAKLINELLLHVIGNNTLLRHIEPEILEFVEIDDGWRIADAHAGIDLMHVSLKGL